jgi:hypothetical protein
MSALPLSDLSRKAVEELWESHRSTIHDLYIRKKGKLLGKDGVIDEMERLLNFRAT